MTASRTKGVQHTPPLIEMRGGGGQGEDGLPNTNTRYSFRFDLRVTLAREVASACHARTRHHHFDRLVIKANKNTGLAWKSRHTCRFGENTHKCHVWVDCRLMRVTFWRIRALFTTVVSVTSLCNLIGAGQRWTRQVFAVDFVIVLKVFPENKVFQKVWWEKFVGGKLVDSQHKHTEHISDIRTERGKDGKLIRNDESAGHPRKNTCHPALTPHLLRFALQHNRHYNVKIFNWGYRVDALCSTIRQKEQLTWTIGAAFVGQWNWAITR